MEVNYNFFLKKGFYYAFPKRKIRFLLPGNKRNFHTGLELYNPFLLRSKIFKIFIKYFPPDLNPFLRKIKVDEDGEFILFLQEKIITYPVYTSLYISSNKFKVILQVQNLEGKPLYFIKISINRETNKLIMNEKRGIDKLKQLNIPTINYYTFGSFNNLAFLMFFPIKGTFKILSEYQILKVLNRLKRPKKYPLKTHPFVKKILSSLEKKSSTLKPFLIKVSNIIEKSSYKYHLAYMHGDFAPWNILQSKDDIYLIDLEYFFEDGLEYMDYIKYFFQIERFLKKKGIKDLLNSIASRIKKIPGYEEIFLIFLLNEIEIALLENRNIDFELQLLELWISKIIKKF